MLALTQIGLTWYLLPLAAAISLVYSCTRYELTSRIINRAVRLFLQVLFFMGVILGVLLALSFQL
ncbi:MAG: hypothetical protein JNG89_03065 [Planctomycetaceae bacterium]|nr:hypothetical protein [Planctomycetaceae bacterium]